MQHHSDRIKPDASSIRTYLVDLLGKKYQIPTFQREVVWKRESAKKLWDSIYRFYPIGSILIWKTDLKLQKHREIGGHVILDNGGESNFQYILDGQQRTTFLLTAIRGGHIAGRRGFDPSLYFDLTIEDIDELDDETYNQRFLFWDEIDDCDGENKRNTVRMGRYKEGSIVRLRSVLDDFESVERKLVEGEYDEYDDPVRKRLRDIRYVLDNYRLSFIELKGIEVSEVCQIFERINQEGKPLDIFDIVVAKTFRMAEGDRHGFYLRELIDQFREQHTGLYPRIDDLTYLQSLAVIIRETLPDAGIANITPKYLNYLRAEHIEEVWGDAKIAFLKMFDFLDNHLHLKGPRLIPYRYFFMTIGSHFFRNRNPNYEFLKKYFWFYSFHYEDLLRNTTHLRQHVDLLRSAREPGKAKLGRFLLDRDRLRSTSYSTRGRFSTAVLSLLANQVPKDWKSKDRDVLTDVYYVLTDKPNLHHIFPINYVHNCPGSNQLDVDSMMNLAYLTQLTNILILDKNPIVYLQEYDDGKLGDVIKGHLIPQDLLTWSRSEKLPDDGLDQFIEKRIDLFVDDLRVKLEGVPFRVFDSLVDETQK